MLKASRFCSFWKTKVDPNSPMKFARIPQKRPYHQSLEAGKKYYWCSCGLSKQQPFCDASHKAYNEQHQTDMQPVAFSVDKSKKYTLCGCKHTSNRPHCDLSHLGVIFRTTVGLEKEP
eukprot:gene5522-gene4150